MSSSQRNIKIAKTSKNMKCSYCTLEHQEVWVNKLHTIMCCRYCWDNHPIVARATLGMSFPLDKIKPQVLF